MPVILNVYQLGRDKMYKEVIAYLFSLCKQLMALRPVQAFGALACECVQRDFVGVLVYFKKTFDRMVLMNYNQIVLKVNG